MRRLDGMVATRHGQQRGASPDTTTRVMLCILDRSKRHTMRTIAAELGLGFTTVNAACVTLREAEMVAWGVGGGSLRSTVGVVVDGTLAANHSSRSDSSRPESI